MEEIRQQISKLEDQFRSNAATIKTKLLNSAESEASYLSNKVELQYVLQIRESLLNLTDGYGEGNNEGDNTFEMEEEVQVKMEPEEDDDLSAPTHEKFLERNSVSLMGEEMEDYNEELFCRDGEDSDSESAFYITPDHVGKSKYKRRQLERNGKLAEVPPSPSGSKNDKKQLRKKRKPSIVKRESHPRTAKTRLVAHNNSDNEKQVDSNAVQPNKINQVGRTRTSRNLQSGNGNDKMAELNSRDMKIEESEEKINRRPYKCKLCLRSFSNQGLLNRHEVWDHRYSCRLCKSGFRGVTALDAHMKQKHNNEAAYQCNICSRKFRRETRFSAHMVMRHETEDKIFSCSKCDKKFSLKINLDRHLELHQVEDVKPFICDVCDARFAKQEALDKHVKTHDQSVTCETCGQVCCNKDTLTSHIRQHTGEKPFKCDNENCDKRFVSVSAMRCHFRRTHDTNRSHGCSLCEKKFFTLSDLKAHLDRHEGKKRHACERCGGEFYTLSTLKSHQIRVHNEEKLICEQCGAPFQSIKGLREHIKKHSGIKPFKCDSCGASFTSKHLLVRHTRSHTNERPYTCEHCGKRFKRTKHLSTHVNRIHNKDYVTPKNYKCPHCEKTYPSNCFMQAHIRSVHTGERPFVCHLCGKGFAIKTVLTLHLKGTHKLQVEGKGWNTLGKSKRDDFSEKEDSN